MMPETFITIRDHGTNALFIKQLIDKTIILRQNFIKEYAANGGFNDL